MLRVLGGGLIEGLTTFAEEGGRACMGGGVLGLDGEDAFKQIFEDDDDLLRFSCFLPGASFFLCGLFSFFLRFCGFFLSFYVFPFLSSSSWRVWGRGVFGWGVVFWVIISFCSLFWGERKK